MMHGVEACVIGLHLTMINGLRIAMTTALKKTRREREKRFWHSVQVASLA